MTLWAMIAAQQKACLAQASNTREAQVRFAKGLIWGEHRQALF